jgi:hypothetical protein
MPRAPIVESIAPLPRNLLDHLGEAGVDSAVNRRLSHAANA